MQTKLIFLPEDSHVNLGQEQGPDLEKRTNDIYFRKCLEQSEKLNPDGLWQRTFMGLLHQNLEKHSKTYAHRWKTKVTPYNRLFFQLHRLKLRINDTDFGKDRFEAGEHKEKRKEREWLRYEPDRNVEAGSFTNAEGQRLSKRNDEPIRKKTHAAIKRHDGISEWENFPTQSPFRNGNDGLSLGLDGITFPKWCSETIKAAGNAVVPQLSFEIFKTIQQYDTRRNKTGG